MAHTFKAGDRLQCINDGGGIYTIGRIYKCLGLDEDGDPVIADDTGLKSGEFAGFFALAPRESRFDRLIAAKKAELAKLEAAAAKRAKDAAERKAKAERAAALKGLTAAGKRVVAMLQAGPGNEFGCQRDSVIALTCAITGDNHGKMRKAITK